MNDCISSIKFSILVPAYNAESYILDNIRSVINQTYSNWELIIVNDGSTDKTLDIIKGIVEENPDKDIKYISIPNGGLANARNEAMKLANGDYFCNLDADDFLDNKTLELIVKAISEEECDVYYYDIYDYDEITHKSSSNCANYSNSLKSIPGIEAAMLKLQRKIWICQGVAFYKTEFINKIGLTNHKGVNQGEDLNFITGALACANKVKYVPDAGGYIRYRSDSMMHAPFNESFLQSIKAIDLLEEFINNGTFKESDKERLFPLIKRERIFQELRVAKSICDSWGQKLSLKETRKALKKYSNIQSSIQKPVREIMPKSHLVQYYMRKHLPLMFIFSTKLYRLLK